MNQVRSGKGTLLVLKWVFCGFDFCLELAAVVLKAIEARMDLLVDIVSCIRFVAACIITLGLVAWWFNW